MKIRTQLIAGFVIFAILLVIISAFVISTNQQAEKLADQEELANQIALEIGELGYLSNDYILYREPQQADRWNVKYASISQDIASLSLDQPEQQGIAANLASNFRTSKLIFDDIASSPVQPGGSDIVFVQLSWSRMAVQNEGMIFNAGRLAHLVRDQADELKQTRLLLILALMGAFVAYLLTSYLLFYRRTLKSLNDLQGGATIVGSGDFSHLIDESSDDEIGDLARSFNKMTLDLRKVTTSKSDLEQEVAKRKQTEEQLQATVQRFYQILAGMPYGILLVTDEDRVEFVNQAFCELFRLEESPDDLLNLTSGEMLKKIRSSYRDPDTAETRIREIINRGDPVKNEDIAMRHGRVFLRAFIPIRLGEKLQGRLWIHLDITVRRNAEEALIQKNEDLNALNEELTATQEELHQNVDELIRREHDLVRALAEKEVLLSEIHHRVKNNLTAFISLLSLEGSTEDTPTGKMLKQDLQNRARSMALIHETLYRTNMYDEVDMGIYLTTLVDQIANSFRMAKAVKTIVNAHGVMLDIPRATPAGLIVNELVTNSFKYAFPDSFDSAAVRHAPPTITITFSKEDGEYRMIVSDNGIGLPPGFDLTKTRTLGLKLVNFLSKHQMRAHVDVRTDKGTEFIFRMDIENGTK